MGNYTTNLSLYNTDMTTDGNDTFDFQRDLNDNNDKIDSAFGNLANLTTTQKANLVSAINEIVSNLDGKTSKSLNDLNAVGQAILDKKVEVEALLAQNGYAKFSWKENNQISKFIIQWIGLTISTSNTTVNLPTSFSNNLYKILGTSTFAGDIGTISEQHIAIGTRTATSFKSKCSSSTLYMNYFAIGY